MNVVFVVAFSFPLGEASSVRALNLVRLLYFAGHSVHVIADIQGKECKDIPCSYECVSDKAVTLKQRNENAKKSIFSLKKYCQNNDVDAVLVNAKYDRYNAIVAYCRKRGIKLFVENCEWYHYSSFKLKFLDYRYFQNQKMILKDFKKADGFISISRLLDKHNKSFGKKSVRVPAILDVTNIKSAVSTNNERYTLIYTGNPSTSKEFLAPIIELLANNNEIRNKFEFHIYGPSKEKVIANIGGRKVLLQAAGNSVIVHGRVPQEQMEKIQRNADFQLFIRPHRRSSDAGFPTKLGESMAVGTPVITNDTGDIALYLQDGYNGYLMKDGMRDELEAVLRRILSLSKREYTELRLNARKTAESAFDFRNYNDEINRLFKQEEDI